MSQLITLNTKKDGAFDCYFEDTIKIPPRSEVAFIKTLGCNIKYSSYEYILLGFVPVDDYDKNMYRFNIDGVNVAITAQNIYDGYNFLTPAGFGVDIGTFWSGTFRYSLVANKPNNIIAAICHALNQRLLFYKVEPAPLVSYKLGNSDQPQITRFGLRSHYSNVKRLDPATLEDYLINIQNLFVYKGAATLLNNKITSTQDDTAVYSLTKMAINGGFVTFNVPNDKKCKVGVSFSTVIQGMQDTNVTGGTNPKLDFGISLNADGPGTYRIIRREIKNNDQAEIDGVKTFSVGAGSQNNFSFLFSRTSSPEATFDTSEYSVFLLQGYDPADDEMNFEDYIVAREKMEGGYMPMFIASNMENGAVLDVIQVIEEEEQDKEARLFVSKTDEPNDNNIGKCGTVFRNTHSIILKNSPDASDDLRLCALILAQDLGFQMLNDDDQNLINTVSTTLGNQLSTPLVIQTRPDADIEYKQFFYLPDQTPNLELFNPNQFIKLFPEPLPYLQLHVESFDLISYEGNYQKQLDSRQQNTATKILQNIPRGEDRRINAPQALSQPELYTSYDYEVFNPIYIALGNPSEINFNQIKARLTTPDNNLVKLDGIDGTPDAKIMIHIRKELATNE